MKIYAGSFQPLVLESIRLHLMFKGSEKVDFDAAVELHK